MEEAFVWYLFTRARERERERDLGSWCNFEWSGVEQDGKE